VQSEIGNSFNNVKKFLKEGKKVLFSGTPCQIAGLKEFLEEDYDKLLTVDLICHGIPSPGVFEEYKQYLEEKYRKKIIDINFRDKNRRGWITPYVIIKFEDGQVIRELHIDNPFIVGFYKGYFVRPVCYSCPFAKTPRVSDITIVDFCGIEEIDPTFYNKKGNSLILANTKKGWDIVNISNDYLTLKEEKIEKAKKFNPRLYQSKEITSERECFMNDAQEMKFKNLKEKYLRPRRLIKKFFSLFFSRRTKNRIKKFLIYRKLFTDNFEDENKD
jgi:coenzyme F420-reducing hydrogenase beta subunit